MIEALLVIALMCISFYGGWRFREHVAQVIVERHFAKAEEAIDANTIKVKIRKEHDSYLVYNESTGAFIVQVRSLEEMKEYFKKTYENINVLATQTDMDEFSK